MPKAKLKSTEVAVKKAKIPRKKHITKSKASDLTVTAVKPVMEKVKHDYFFAVGRRKSSVARVRYYKKGNQTITINNQDYKKYFPYFEFQQTVEAPLTVLNHQQTGEISVRVTGGGKRGQAEATRLGISRILVNLVPESRSLLRSEQFLTRDPRTKERKKYGLKKARRAPQWQKR